jgi:hypothetical protein
MESVDHNHQLKWNKDRLASNPWRLKLVGGDRKQQKKKH